jgi:hypothetical protein
MCQRKCNPHPDEREKKGENEKELLNANNNKMEICGN